MFCFLQSSWKKITLLLVIVQNGGHVEEPRGPKLPVPLLCRQMESFCDSQRYVLSTSGRFTPTKDTPYTALMEVQWLFPLLRLIALQSQKPRRTMKTLMKAAVKAFL